MLIGEAIALVRAFKWPEGWEADLVDPSRHTLHLRRGRHSAHITPNTLDARGPAEFAIFLERSMKTFERHILRDGRP